MKMLKITAAVAFALAMAGCGDSGSKDAAASGAANTSGNAAANVAAKPAKTYSPKVLADTEVAVQYRKNTSAALQPLVDALENAFKKGLAKDIAKKDGDKEVDKAKKFFKESGLQDAELKWALLTFGSLNVAEIETDDKVPDFGFAFAIDHDIGKIVAAFKNVGLDAEKNETIDEIEVAGEKAWKIEDDDTKKQGVELCFASLDGTLLLAGVRRAVLGNLIALYRDGKGESDTFAAFAGDKSMTLGCYVPNLGKIVKSGGQDLSTIDMIMPDGSRIVKELADLSFAIKGDSDGAEVKLLLNAGNADDGDSIRTIVKAALMPAVASMKNSDDEDSKTAYEIVKNLAIGGEGAAFTATLPVSKEAIAKLAAKVAEESSDFFGDDDDDDDDADDDDGDDDGDND